MKKRVLFVISELYGGGAERALSNIMTHFSNEWDIDLLVNSRNRIGFPYKGNILSLNMKDFKNGKSPLYLMKELVQRTKYLRELKKKNQYSACISFLDSANIANVLSGNRYCKTIISIRVSMLSPQTLLIYKIAAFILMRTIYKKADKIVTVSKEIEEEMKMHFRLKQNQIVTIVNGYDRVEILRQSLEPPQLSLKIKPENRVIVTVGRLDSQKGQWHLVRAFFKVVRRQPDAKLLILGEGNLRRYIEELITNYRLENNVVLLGFCENPYWYMAKADIFVMPSLYEGFPNALAEAVCLGIPCISTDFHSGAREILAPELNLRGKTVDKITEAEYGILTPICSGRQYKYEEPLEDAENKLADAILDILENCEKKQYYRNQSLKRAAQLDINDVVIKWEELSEG